MRNLFETSESPAATLEREFLNFRTDVNERTTAKSSLDDMVISSETLLKYFNDVRTVHCARLRSLGTESMSLRRQLTDQAASFTGARDSSAQFKFSKGAFLQYMRAAIYVSIG